MMPGRVPDWYRDAKLGIMIHWGLPSVTAFAPAEHGSISNILSEHDWPFYFRNNPYSEWYLNCLRLGDTPTRAFHRRKFRRAYPYERLADRFNDDLKKWQPQEWADLFREVGARYVVLVAKHHDGFLMWPSDHRPPNPDYVAGRDVVGELAEAVREKELRYGLYYSGLLDWTIQSDPIADFPDLLNVKTDAAYSEYVRNHFHELVSGYKPDMLWNDIGLPTEVSRRALFQMYRGSVPDGVLNDRWMQVSPWWRRLLSLSPVRRGVAAAARKALASGGLSRRHGDVATIEYGTGTSLRSRPWEAVRSIGNSFALNEHEPQENYLTGAELSRMLADVVSKNGNLLLNVGPRSDGTIPPEQKKPLLELGAWIRTNGEAIHNTRPWNRAEGETGDGQPVRFTVGANALYAILLERPQRLSVTLTNIDVNRIPRSGPARGTDEEFNINVLGCDRPISWRVIDNGLEVRLPGAFVPAGPAVIALRWRDVEQKARPIEMYVDVIG